MDTVKELMTGTAQLDFMGALTFDLLIKKYKEWDDTKKDEFKNKTVPILLFEKVNNLHDLKQFKDEPRKRKDNKQHKAQTYASHPYTHPHLYTPHLVPERNLTSTMLRGLLGTMGAIGELATATTSMPERNLTSTIPRDLFGSMGQMRSMDQMGAIEKPTTATMSMNAVTRSNNNSMAVTRSNNNLNNTF